MIVGRDGRLSTPAIRIRPNFHYPAKSASGRIARFTPDRIGANYYWKYDTTLHTLLLAIAIYAWKKYSKLQLYWASHRRLSTVAAVIS